MIIGWAVAAALLLLALLLAVWNRRLGERLADRDRLAAALAKYEEAEATMRAAGELAQSAMRVKNDFFANMSHEIRTPMNAVIGLSNLLLKTSLTAHQRGYLTKIQQAAQMLLEIVNDILDFTKAEAGKLVLERTEFEPDEILDRVGNLIGGRAAAKGLEVIFNVDPRLNFSLVGDPLRLSQIFVNYASNAVKFTEQGEIELSVEVREDGGGEVLLYCAVRDTGIGLSETQRDRLFQPFQQADTSITRQYGGTGLGLAICKTLAEAMGGAVGIDSVAGQGSTFWFTARLGRGATTAGVALDAELRGLPILVVDDHPRARAVFAAILTGMGFAVTTAATGRDAVDAIAAAEPAGEPFAAVLLDAEMADLDGFETAAGIRALGLDPPPRIILMIGAWGEEVTDEARQVGIEYLLPKPFTPSLLLNIVSHALLDPEGGPQPAPDAEPAVTDRGPERWRGCRVLLVEDNELNQDVALGLLGEFGLAVELAADGAIAVDKVLGNPPDHYAAVLMDMQMPVMDGLTATRTIRAAPGYRDLPIIAMTANALAEDRARALAAGMNDHVAKPIAPEVLRATLARWIDGDLTTADDTSNLIAPPGRAELPAEAAGLPVIAGLDTAVGLRRMMGNAAHYLALLRKFAERHEDAGQAIEQALRAGDGATAERLAHDLKSVAGSIGAGPLAAQAQHLEAALRAGASCGSLDAEFARLAAALDTLLAGLRQQLPPPATAAAPPGPLDRTGAGQASRQLARLLADSDVAAIRFLTDNSAVLRNTFGAHFRDVEAATEGFDFAAALGALRRAASDLEIAL